MLAAVFISESIILIVLSDIKIKKEVVMTYEIWLEMQADNCNYEMNTRTIEFIEEYHSINLDRYRKYFHRYMEILYG